MVKQRYYLPLITSLGGLLLVFNGVAISAPLVSSPQLLTQTNKTPQQIAQKITVRVYAGDSSGSGVLIAKNEQTYTVITNAHVVKRGEPYRIQTPDGMTHNATLKTAEDALTGNDLALLQFNSNNNYSLATFAPTDPLKPNESVYAAGFPYDSSQISISEGNVTLLTPKPIIGGYQIGFSNPTEQGMSGGVLLNEKGELVGILGKGNAIFTEAYNYQDGTSPDSTLLQQMQQANFAIPIEPVAFLTKLYTEEGTETQIPREVNQIAENITVRIDRPNTDYDGSGVIAGRNGQTYYVLTASHVVKDFSKVKIITPDNKSYTVNQNGIKTFEELDLAVVEFSSEETYEVATLADYPLGRIKQGKKGLDFHDPLVFLSGFPIVKSGEPTRKMSAGFAFPRYSNLLITKDYESFLEGTELIYNAQSFPGMSGGAVLDQQGRVIGINTGEERYEIGKEEQKTEEISLGSSLGVPIKTFLGQFSRANLNPQWFKVETNSPQLLSKEQNKQIIKSLWQQKPPTESSSVVEWLKYGRFISRLGENEQAIKAYDQAIKRNPQLHQAYYWKGRSLFINDQTEEAVVAFEKVLELKPKYYPALFWKAASLRNLEKYSQALATIDKAIQKRPEDSKAYMERGWILEDLERYPEAEEALTQAIKLKPNAQAYLTRSRSRSLWRERQGAIADATQAILLQPNLPLAYYHRVFALTLNDASSFDDKYGDNAPIMIKDATHRHMALQDITMAIQLDPDDISLYTKRANIRKDLNDCQGAIDDYTKVINNSSLFDLFYEYGLRGMCYGELGEWEKAINDYNKAIEIEPNNPVPYSSKASYHRKIGEIQKALVNYNKIIEIEPNDFYSYISRSEIYILLNGEIEKGIADLQKAEEILTKKIQKNPNDFNSYKIRALARKLLGNAQGAEEDFQKVQQMLNAKDPSLLLEGLEPWDKLREGKEPIRNYYTQAIKADPNNARLYFYRGIVEHNLRNYERALADFNRSLSLDPNHPKAYYRRSLTYQALNDYSQALADLNKALDLNIFEETSIYYNRGLVKKQSGDYQGAIEDFNRVIKRQPNNYLAWAGKRESYVALQDYQNAIQILSEWLKLQPNNGNLYSLRGELWLKEGDINAALLDYNKAIEINSHIAKNYYYRGEIYAQQGNQDKAFADYKFAVEKDEKLSDVRLKISSIYAQQGENELGLQQFQQAIKFDSKLGDVEFLDQKLRNEPNNAVLYVLRGQSFSRQGKIDLALKDFDKAIELDKKFISAYQIRGNFYFQQNSFKKALADYNEIIKINPNRAYAYFNKGGIYHKQGDLEKAIVEYQLSLEKDQNHSDSMHKLAYIYYEKGKVELAIEQLEKAKQLSPSSELDSANLPLAVILYSQGEQGKALKMAKAFLFLYLWNNSRWTNVDEAISSLKRDLWGDKLLAEAQKLFEHPEITAIINRSSNTQ